MTVSRETGDVTRAVPQRGSRKSSPCRLAYLDESVRATRKRLRNAFWGLQDMVAKPRMSGEAGNRDFRAGEGAVGHNSLGLTTPHIVHGLSPLSLSAGTFTRPQLVEEPDCLGGEPGVMVVGKGENPKAPLLKLF